MPPTLCLNNLLNTMIQIGVLLGLVVASFVGIRLIAVPAIHADNPFYFWDSPAYSDFGDSIYWTESLQLTAFLWAFIVAAAVVIALVSFFVEGAWCCCKASLWNAIRIVGRSRASSSDDGPQGDDATEMPRVTQVFVGDMTSEDAVQLASPTGLPTAWRNSQGPYTASTNAATRGLTPATAYAAATEFP